MLALEDRLRSREARVPEERRHDTRVSRPARVQSFGPRAVGQVLDDSARLAPADSEGVNQLVLRQRIELAGGGGRTEGPRERGGMIVARVEFAGHREAHATHHLHAGDDRLEGRPPGRAGRLADRQAGGDRDRPRVDDGVFARVVEVQPVSERRIRQRGIGRRHPHLAPNQRALRRSAEPLDRRAGRGGEVVSGRSEAAPERVQRQQLRLVHDGPSQVFQAQLDDEASETPRGRERHVG